MAARRSKTQTIGGIELTLIEGIRYVASRPMAARNRRAFPITIQPAFGSPPDVEEVRLGPLSYDEANKLLAAFNNGPASFAGRVW